MCGLFVEVQKQREEREGDGGSHGGYLVIEMTKYPVRTLL